MIPYANNRNRKFLILHNLIIDLTESLKLSNSLDLFCVGDGGTGGSDLKTKNIGIPLFSSYNIKLK